MYCNIKKQAKGGKMNKTIILVILLLLFNVAISKGNDKFSLNDFSIELSSIISPPNHIWVSSGYSTVNPTYLTVMGVNECISPPFAARGFNLKVEMTVNGHNIKDIRNYGKGDVGLLYTGGIWKPDKIIRRGTYHHFIDGELISFGVISELIPLFNTPGFVLRVTITNRTDSKLDVQLVPILNPGKPNYIPLNNWSYGRPIAGKRAETISQNVWGNDKVKITLIEENSHVHISPQKTNTIYFSFVLSEKDNEKIVSKNLQIWQEETNNAWQKRLTTYLKNVPKLTSDIPELEEYYNRSLVSGLVCIWENPNFVMNPFLTTLGIDGGGICTYLWDLGGYVPNIATLMLGEKMINIARNMVSIDLKKYYAFTLDGSGVGVKYSYSVFAYMNLVWAISRHSGINKDLFDEAIKLVLNDENNSIKKRNLIDYGVQRNLLEMRGAGWEHFVVSPNAERAWCLNRLADIGELVNYNQNEINNWRESAKNILSAIQDELWDDRAKWLKCKYPDDHEEVVYSIQVYDALRAGACTSEMFEHVVSHLRDGAFLGKCGVHSVSQEDEIHFEVNDPDWSGGGAYTGDGPQLALTMYEQSRPELAWDILKRHFWMGQYLPYYPQEHFADRPSVPANKRANEVSGLGGAEAIIYGLAGFQPETDGSLWISPQPPADGKIKLEGFVFKGNIIDIEMKSDWIKILLNGDTFYEGNPSKMKLINAID